MPPPTSNSSAPSSESFGAICAGIDGQQQQTNNHPQSILIEQFAHAKIVKKRKNLFICHL
jgi:hypothetical protein